MTREERISWMVFMLDLGPERVLKNNITVQDMLAWMIEEKYLVSHVMEKLIQYEDKYNDT